MGGNTHSHFPLLTSVLFQAPFSNYLPGGLSAVSSPVGQWMIDKWGCAFSQRYLSTVTGWHCGV